MVANYCSAVAVEDGHFHNNPAPFDMKTSMPELQAIQVGLM